MTVKQISKSNRLTVNQVTGRIYALDLSRLKQDKHVATFFDARRRANCKFYRQKKRGSFRAKKILIIEYYLTFPKSTAAELADILSTNTIAVNKILSDWENDNYFLTVKSKI
jgi:hypothetical protein